MAMMMMIVMRLYFKDTYCIGIQDDWVEVSIGISIWSGTYILHGIEYQIANPEELNSIYSLACKISANPQGLYTSNKLQRI